MPVVVLANTYLFAEQEGYKGAELRVEARTHDDVFCELAIRFPQLAHWLLDATTGLPERRFTLFRDADGENVRYLPEYTFDEDERFILLDSVAC